MKLLKISTILCVLFLTFKSYAQIKNLNIEKSLLNWTGKAAFSSYTLTGNIQVKQGQIEIKNDSITSLKIIIDMKSINHEYGDLEKHLKSKDFFEIKKFENAYFELTKPSIITNNKAILIGNITVKNITHQETFSVTFGNDYNSIFINIELDRTKYGVKFNSPSFFKKMKENAIADEFKLEGLLKFDD